MNLNEIIYHDPDCNYGKGTLGWECDCPAAKTIPKINQLIQERVDYKVAELARMKIANMQHELVKASWRVAKRKGRQNQLRNNPDE